MILDPITQNYLVLSPQASSSPDETHAAMVVSQASFSDVRFSAGFTTLEQLRTGSAPNPWESAWAVFGYTDDDHFYYVAFKPNGWELGKVDPAYPGGQRFLATGSTPVSAIGTEHSFDIQQDGNVIKVSLDGVLLTTFTDTERPYLSGKVGFYTEDAKVAFDNVSGSITENFEGFSAQTFSDGATLGSLWETPYVGYGFGAIESEGAPPPPPPDPIVLPAPSDLFDLPTSAEPTNNIVGTAGDDRLSGTRHNDLVDGRGGVDRMTGRNGDDTYKVDSLGERVVEKGGEGVDTVRSTASAHTLGANVENLILEGATVQRGVGNALDNILVSNNVQGILKGGDGHDILVSGKGSDLLTGGSGSDTFVFTEVAAARRITDFEAGIDKIVLHHLDGPVSFATNPQGGTDIFVDAILVTTVDGVAPSAVELDVFWL